jgi:alanyl-tRNA synthetase
MILYLTILPISLILTIRALSTFARLFRFGSRCVRHSPAGRANGRPRIVFMEKEKSSEYLAKAENGVEKTKDLTRKQEERVKSLTKFGHEPHAAERDLEDAKRLEQSVEKTRDIISEQLKNRSDD